jgi:hypothetical protein
MAAARSAGREARSGGSRSWRCWVANILCPEHAGMTGEIPNGGQQAVAGVGGQSLAGGQFLRCADLDQQPAASFQVFGGLSDEAVEEGETIRSAVQGQVRLIVADAGGQPG